MKKEIKKITIWDFDGTLVDSPLPEIGRGVYLEKTGKEFPHKGWWSKRETLDFDIFDIPMIESVKEDYDKVKDETDTVKIMLTGRILPLKKQVEAILSNHGLEFDEYHYNSGGPTEIYKMRIMDELLDKYPDADEMSLWDDRLEHIPIFEEFLKKKVEVGRLKRFKITVVPAGRH